MSHIIRYRIKIRIRGILLQDVFIYIELQTGNRSHVCKCLIKTAILVKRPGGGSRIRIITGKQVPEISVCRNRFTDLVQIKGRADQNRTDLGGFRLTEMFIVLRDLPIGIQINDSADHEDWNQDGADKQRHQLFAYILSGKKVLV